MIKLISVSAIMAVLTLPAFATIQSGSTCDTTNLGQSENNSTANVEADWTANTININWYIDDTAQITLTTNTCTYDGTITLPQEPTKTGYTFAGWQLRANAGASQAPAQQANCPSISYAECDNTPGCTTGWGDESGCYYIGECNFATESECNNSHTAFSRTPCRWVGGVCTNPRGPRDWDM